MARYIAAGKSEFAAPRWHAYYTWYWTDCGLFTGTAFPTMATCFVSPTKVIFLLPIIQIAAHSFDTA